MADTRQETNFGVVATRHCSSFYIDTQYTRNRRNYISETNVVFISYNFRIRWSSPRKKDKMVRATAPPTPSPPISHQNLTGSLAAGWGNLFQHSPPMVRSTATGTAQSWTGPASSSAFVPGALNQFRQYMLSVLGCFCRIGTKIRKS